AGGPAAPILAVTLERDRLEDREAAQRFAAFGEKAGVVGENGIAGATGAGALEGAETRAQHGAFDRPHRLVIDGGQVGDRRERPGLREGGLELPVAGEVLARDN